MAGILSQLLRNPRGWGDDPNPAPEAAYEDDAGNIYDADGRKIQNWQPPQDGMGLYDAATAPARMATALAGALSPYGGREDGGYGWRVPPMVQEPINAMQRLAKNSRLPDGRLGIPDPSNPQNRQDVLTGLLTMYGGNAVGALRRSLPKATESSTFASKNASIFDPPKRPQRAFEDDYPKGARADEQGRLSHDIDGRPITAEYIAGRRAVGGADEVLAPAEIDAITEAITGNRPTGVASSAIGGNAGAFSVSHATGQPVYNSFFNKTLEAPVADRVVAHELSHGIDYLAGGRDGIPTDELFTRRAGSGLGQVYHDLGDKTWRRGKPTPDRYQTTPKQHGYHKPGDIRAEYMAEAIRAYLTDPNYIKTVAPKTAARIREYVNSNPRLNKTIQFNSGSAGLSPAGGAFASNDSDTAPSLARMLRSNTPGANEAQSLSGMLKSGSLNEPVAPADVQPWMAQSRDPSGRFGPKKPEGSQ